jgi:hypothetical protein
MYNENSQLYATSDAEIKLASKVVVKTYKQSLTNNLQVKLFNDVVIETSGRNSSSKIDQPVQRFVLIFGQELKNEFQIKIQK